MSLNIENDYTPKSESFYIESEQFHTLIGQLQSSESSIVINTLADNLFKYQIIMSDETAPLVTPTPYVFNLSTDL